MGERAEIDQKLLFTKFVEISERQASALATLAERQARDDLVLSKIAANQDSISSNQERIATRLDHMDEEANRRAHGAVAELKGFINGELRATAMEALKSDRWVKVLAALLAFIAALMGTLVTLQAIKP